MCGVKKLSVLTVSILKHVFAKRNILWHRGAVDFEARETGADDLEKIIQAASKMDDQSGIEQSVYVVEECSELVKELMKQ